MSRKILYVATVVKRHIMAFHVPFLKMLKEEGWETAVAARNDYENPEDCQIPYCDCYYDLPFSRQPLARGNIKAYQKLKEIIDKGDYEIIHCHTPVGAALARLAARDARKKGTKVVYTAHGFHFYEGAPLLNWMLFYPIERILSHVTDALITINQEDYQRAVKEFSAKEVAYMPGVGVEIARFDPGILAMTQKEELKQEVGIPEQALWLISVGELNANKDHRTVIEAIASICQEKPELGKRIFYTIAGTGNLRQELLDLIEDRGLKKQVKLLGFRKDIAKLDQMADLFVFPSRREGLAVALMEAMAADKPCVVSRIRGNVDLIEEHGGRLFSAGDIRECAGALAQVLLLPADERQKMGRYNRNTIKQYDCQSVVEMMRELYQRVVEKG